MSSIPPEEEAFDPYRKWLGIPPEEQPPHHYRLLGLELFEGDGDVIINAVDARTTFLRTFVDDSRSDMASQILAQIKEAQGCLLDPAKKAFYDGQLQRRMAALKKNAEAASRAASATPIAPRVGPTLDPRFQEAPILPSAPRGMPEHLVPELQIVTPSVRKRSTRRSWPYLAALLLGTVSAICIGVWLAEHFGPKEKSTSVVVSPDTKNPTRANDKANASGGTSSSSTGKDDSSSTKHSTAQASDSSSKESIKGTGTTTEKGTSPTSKDSSNGGTSYPRMVEAAPPWASRNNPPPPSRRVSIPQNSRNPWNSNESSTPSTVLPETPVQNESGRKPSEFADDSFLSRSSKIKQKPIPEETVRQSAEKAVRDVYGKQIVAAKGTTAKFLLATTIWKKAEESTDKVPDQFALMSLACQLSGESGRLQNTMRFIDLFAKHFEINPWEYKAEAAVRAVQASRTSPQEVDGLATAILCEQFAEEARRAGQFDVAVKTIKSATALVKKDLELYRDLNTLGRELDRQKLKYQPVRKALETLKEKPDDPAANGLAGRWVCFENRDWEKGLPMLSKSSDSILSKLASKDLSSPSLPAQQLEVADAWWEFAQKEEGTAKSGVLSRAQYWYLQAQPALTGLNRTKVDTRLKTLATGEDEGFSNRGIVKLGNVALASNGTQVQGVEVYGDKLFDGISSNPPWDTEAANSPIPCEWIITFDQVYQLREIRFHFYNVDKRYYRYSISVSSDGINFKPLIDRNNDHTQGQWFGWQRLNFPSRPVKAIKLNGLYSSRNTRFSVTEFEAYCIPPKP